MQNFISVIISLSLCSCIPTFLVQSFKESHSVNFNEIGFFAKMSSMVYKEGKKIRNYVKNDSLGEVLIYDLKETQNKFILISNHNKKVHYISIAGTANIKNVESDVEFFYRNDDRLKIKCHEGFSKGAKLVYNKILSKLNRKYDLYITGHSLGGAEAVVLAMYLDVEKIKVKKIVTFGQPKTTNQEGINKFSHLNLLRVVNKRDPVPYLPPVDSSLNIKEEFRHFGKAVILLKDNFYSFLENVDSQGKAASYNWGNVIIDKIFLLEPKHHFIKNYLKNIRNKFLKATEVAFIDRAKYL